MAAIKIPKYIRQKMHRIAHLHATANKEMQVVEAWLENQGFDTSMQGLRCGNGCGRGGSGFGSFDACGGGLLLCSL